MPNTQIEVARAEDLEAGDILMLEGAYPWRRYAEVQESPNTRTFATIVPWYKSLWYWFRRV